MITKHLHTYQASRSPCCPLQMRTVCFVDLFATWMWKSMVPMQSIDVPFAATLVSSGGAHMLPTSSFICLRKSSHATVASAPVSCVTWALVIKLSSAL